MAQFTVNALRFDPYKNFKFRARWDGRYVAGVSKVGGLKRTTEVVKHREGGDPSSSRKSPGRTEFEAITIERGVTHDPEFEKWASKVWNFGAGLGSKTSGKRSSSRSTTRTGNWRWPTRCSAAGCPNTRPCPSSTPTPTPWRSRPSSWKTKGGSVSARSPYRPN